jgi:hypothetical protein
MGEEGMLLPFAEILGMINAYSGARISGILMNLGKRKAPLTEQGFQKR